jgi:hypothetical protein
MFESGRRLSDDIHGLLGALRATAGGRYACVVDPRRILFEDPEPEDAGGRALRGTVDAARSRMFGIPASLASDEPMEDVFDDWDEDEFLIAYINGRVAVLVACPDAEALRRSGLKLLHAMADRLFRLDQTYRLDAQGRGLFFGRARLDVIVIGRAEA